jgi:hypothetical protein
VPEENLSPDSRPRLSPADEPGIQRHAVWLLVCFALLSVFPYYGQINNPNENARVWMVRAIVDHHQLSINDVTREWGYVNDKAVMDGRLYSGKAPGTSLLGVPIYFVQRALAGGLGQGAPSKRSMTLALRLFGVGLPLSIFLFFFARYIERLTRSAAARDLLVVGLGLGTMLYPYGVLFVGHALAAALAFSGFMLLSWERQGAARPDRLAWAGSLVGLSVVFEYQVIFAAVVLTAYAIARHRRGALYFLAGALPPAILLGAYHTALFGRPWRFPFSHIENPEWARLHNDVRFFGLRVPDPFALGKVLFSVDLGLFAFSPFLLVGLASAVVLLARRTSGKMEAGVILAITVLMVGFLAGVPAWHSGWCVGPRYIAVVAPFLAAGIAYLWRSTRHVFALSAITAGLVIPSVLLNVISGAVYPHYPEQFDNPVFDLTIPLLGAGYAPYSLGWLLGLPGRWSLAPLAGATIVAVAIAVAGESARPRRWLAHVALAVCIAAALLVPLCRYGRRPSSAESSAAAFVRSTWEPPPRAHQ